MISVRSGPDAGAVYQLLPPRVTIGRDPASNNVVVNDPKVSRNAAVIEFSPEDISILDVSGRGKLSVNGQSGERLSIKGGDLIRIGDSELAFVVEAMQLPSVVPNQMNPNDEFAAPLALAGMPGLPTHQQPPRPHGPQMGGASDPRPSTHRQAPKKSGRGTFYAVVGILFAGLIYIGMSDQVAKKLDKGLRTTSEIEKDIADTDARNAEVVKKRAFRTEEEKTRYEEAQKHYIEGFRDYQKGNYTRAMRSFETARAIDPEHVLARRYFRQAEKQRDEAITNFLLEGRRYREKNMYSRCSAAIEKALITMPNKADLKYKQAEAMKKECDLLQDSRF
jgi:pSer/pThr/pTyr-binding forkhead associated (FHA) protein